MEISFSVSLMLSQGSSRFTPSVIAMLAALLSIWLMSLTLSVLLIGAAHAVWAGIGAAGSSSWASSGYSFKQRLEAWLKGSDASAGVRPCATASGHPARQSQRHFD